MNYQDLITSGNEQLQVTARDLEISINVHHKGGGGYTFVMIGKGVDNAILQLAKNRSQTDVWSS